jgi:hypothetical protein
VKAASVIAAGFFFIWLGILYAGADHPPPPGFLLLVVLDLIAAIAVFFRVPAYGGWSGARRRHRIVRVLSEGLVTGLLVAAVVALVPFGGEPSRARPAATYLIWFAVVGAAGAANALAVQALQPFRPKAIAEGSASPLVICDFLRNLL